MKTSLKTGLAQISLDALLIFTSGNYAGAASPIVVCPIWILIAQWITANIPLDFASGNIRRDSLRLRRIIVKCYHISYSERWRHRPRVLGSSPDFTRTTSTFTQSSTQFVRLELLKAMLSIKTCWVFIVFAIFKPKHSLIRPFWVRRCRRFDVL